MSCNICSSGNIKMERTQKGISNVTIIVTILMMKIEHIRCFECAEIITKISWYSMLYLRKFLLTSRFSSLVSLYVCPVTVFGSIWSTETARMSEVAGYLYE